MLGALVGVEWWRPESSKFFDFRMVHVFGVYRYIHVYPCISHFKRHPKSGPKNLQSWLMKKGVLWWLFFAVARNTLWIAAESWLATRIQNFGSSFLVLLDANDLVAHGLSISMYFWSVSEPRSVTVSLLCANFVNLVATLWLKSCVSSVPWHGQRVRA